jgi:Protein of unknown function (DUF2946)
LAVLLALFSALTPTVSQTVALAHAGDHVGVEICTSTGPQWLAVFDSAESSPGQESAPKIEHCPFCLHQADRIAPPASPVATLFLGSDGQQEVVVWQAFFYFPHLYPRAAPRGPPALS